MMPNKPGLQTVAAEEQDLRARLKKAEESLREILSGESDGLFVAGARGAQLFTLKGADQSYRTLIESMSEGALTLTSAGLILYANRRFAGMLKTPLEKVIGSDIHDWFAPESRQVLQTLLRLDVVGNRREELALAAADGTPVPVNLSVCHLKLEGMPDSFCMVATDLTQQKHHEAILAAESLARAILEQAADAIVICDGTGLILRASRQAQALYGDSPVGQHFEHAFPLRQPDGAAFSPVEAIDTSGRQAIEARLERDGQGFDLLVSVGHLKGARDELLGSVITLTDITERRRGEEDVRRFSVAMDTVPDAIFLIERSTMRFVHINDAACRFQGQTRAEILALEPWVLFGTSRTELERTYDALIASGADVEPVEMSWRHRDGSQLWIELRHHAQHSGNRWTIVSLVRDITARKQGEDALRESKNLLQLVVENVPSRIFWKDRDLRYLGCNTRFAKDAGYSSPSELTGKTDFEMAWKDQAELYRSDDKAVLESGAPRLDIEEPQTTPDGNTMWLRTSKVPLRDKDNRIIGVLGLYQDITERKQAESSLRESERRFSDLLGNVELISMMLDREARITYCNEYLLRLTGWRLEEVIGKNWFDSFLPAEIHDLKGGFFASLIANLPEAWHHENEILTRSGERRLIRWNNSVLRSGAGEVIGTASIGEDITEQKRAEISIKRLNRVYAVLSGINTLIVRCRDRQELFEQACRIVVDEGQFRLAWIGLLDANSLDVTPVAKAGIDEGYLDNMRLTARENVPDSCTLVTRVLQEKTTVVCNDIDTDPQMAHWREEALRRGYRSVVVFPLQFADKVSGVLLLYASEKGFFDTEELKLLTELAGNISFAIDNISKQTRLDYLAYHDELTGLANRTLFLDRVAQYMRSAASGGHKLAVILIDLERFKNINDSLGRPAGDALLQQVAEWLVRNAGDANLLARLEADHFAAVLPVVKPDGDLGRLLEKTMAAFVEHPFRLKDAVFRVAAKVGAAVFPEDGADAETLFRHAEAALKKAKASGERYLFYTQKMTEAVAGKLSLENQLRQALEKEEFVLHYQPKVNLDSGKMTSAEALLRWNDPRTGLVPPGRFIPILEETGMIYEVGRWALRQALKDYLRWRAAGLAAVRIAVNVSPLQLRSRGFIDEIKQAIGVDAHAADGLELELTESLIMEDVKFSIASLQAIRELGVSIAIDDFGTGFSSLSYLARLPVNTLKIDRSFINQMTVTPEGLGLVSTVITLAHSLKLKVVAEGVETEEQSRLLRLLRCDEMQGFLFSKPVPAEIFEAKFLSQPPAW